MEQDQGQTLEQEKTHALLVSNGFPPKLKLDASNFPDPGTIIRFYRQRMKYTDKDGKIRSWTQADLARRLDVSEVTVRLMETQGKGLDSIGRRRAIAEILKIPPILLGLASLEDLLALLGHNNITEPAKTTRLSNGTIKLYQDTLSIYSEKHATSTAKESSIDIEKWIRRIQYDLTDASQRQRSELYRVLWGFHDLAAKVYDDMYDWRNALSHLNDAREIAVEMNSNDFLAASLYRSSQLHLSQKNPILAKSDLTAGLDFAKKSTNLSLKGAVFSEAALSLALVDPDLAAATYAQRLLDQAEKYAGENTDNDEFSLRFTTGRYLFTRGSALLALKRPSVALEFLDSAEDVLDQSQKRRLAYVNILRAEAYMRLKRPEYDSATILLLDALDVSRAIKSGFNIGRIRRLYKLLSMSSYGNSPQVADLGLQLRDLS
jgi:transcriptional regulator with XRE-family HTH domain